MLKRCEKLIAFTRSYSIHTVVKFGFFFFFLVLQYKLSTYTDRFIVAFSRRYRKFIKSVFDRLTAVLHHQSVVAWFVHAIIDNVRSIVSGHDIHGVQVTEITHTHARTR